MADDLTAEIVRPTQAEREAERRALATVKPLIRDLGDMACIGCHHNTCPACALAAEITNEAHLLYINAVVAARADERDLRHDNADLARQLTDACARRADAFDEGHDKAMQDAHYVLNRMGYLERRGEDNGNPYRDNTPGQDDA